MTSSNSWLDLRRFPILNTKHWTGVNNIYRAPQKINCKCSNIIEHSYSYVRYLFVCEGNLILGNFVFLTLFSILISSWINLTNIRILMAYQYYSRELYSCNMWHVVMCLSILLILCMYALNKSASVWVHWSVFGLNKVVFWCKKVTRIELKT